MHKTSNMIDDMGVMYLADRSQISSDVGFDTDMIYDDGTVLDIKTKLVDKFIKCVIDNYDKDRTLNYNLSLTMDLPPPDGYLYGGSMTDKLSQFNECVDLFIKHDLTPFIEDQIEDWGDSRIESISMVRNIENELHATRSKINEANTFRITIYLIILIMLIPMVKMSDLLTELIYAFAVISSCVYIIINNQIYPDEFNKRHKNNHIPIGHNKIVIDFDLDKSAVEEYINRIYRKHEEIEDTIYLKHSQLNQ